MAATGKTYKIETVTDFLEVPADRREAMFADFRKFLEFGDTQKPVWDAVKMLGGTATISFTWIDDGDVGLAGVRVTTEFGNTSKMQEGR